MLGQAGQLSSGFFTNILKLVLNDNDVDNR